MLADCEAELNGIISSNLFIFAPFFLDVNRGRVGRFRTDRKFGQGEPKIYNIITEDISSHCSSYEIEDIIYESHHSEVMTNSICRVKVEKLSIFTFSYFY